jgi:hypothetical protein
MRLRINFQDGLMDGDGTLKQLAQELSPGERKDLLQKLRNQFVLNQDPLYGENNFPEIEVENEYARLPWYYHICYLVLSFFFSKSPVNLYYDREIAKAGRIINEQAPGFYDYSRSLLLPEFYRELVDLKESARFFFNALNVSVNRDRGAFYAFLGSLVMEDIHNRLDQETEPAKIWERNPGTPVAELRRIAFRKLEDTIGLINETQRTTMYANIRFLYCLKELASFLFDRVIMAFNHDVSVGGLTCSALAVRELLSNLNNILFSLKKIPSMSLFESLFVFMLQDQMKHPGFDVNAEIRRLLSQAERSLMIIRKFNQTAPLTLIVRCASRDMALSPVLISGGEDWLVVYRDYWKHLIDDRFTLYLRTTRSRELYESLSVFFKGINLKLLGNVETETNPGGIPVKEALSLSFLRTYHSVVFAEDNAQVLKSILIDGTFSNRTNQIDFSTAYNELNRLEETIDGFNNLISPSGDFGIRYEAARTEMSSAIIKRRKIQAVINEISGAAIQIISQSKTAFFTMINILNEIMKEDAVGKYGVLINYSKLAGKGNAFMENLVAAARNSQSALKLLDEISLLEEE